MKFLFVFLIATSPFRANAQQRYNAALIDTLEKIANTNTPSKYFAKLYHDNLEVINKYIVGQPDSVRQFVVGFQEAAGPIFLKSYNDHVYHLPQIPAWQFYYADSSLNEMQYQFIGMNAHINGDMWSALKDRYGYDTLKKYKYQLLKCQKALDIFFDSMYVKTARYKKLKHLRFYTLGLDKAIGKRMLFTWRKKQVQLAMLYYSYPAKWKRKLKRSQSRMRRWNRFAVKWIK